MPIYLHESDVEELLSPADAVEQIEACFRRIARGRTQVMPRSRLGLDGGTFYFMAASDLELGVTGFKAYTGFPAGARFVVGIFATDRPELLAMVDAARLSQLRTGAASAVAARHLARKGAVSLGVIGTGLQAVSQVACIRAALPGLQRVVAYSRRPDQLAAFCELVGAEAAESAREAAEQDVVVTITTSPEPVLLGEWLRPGALVCAAGANRQGARELDDNVLSRAALVCCDLQEQARLEASDLIEPVSRGILDWSDIRELSEVVTGAQVRRDDADIVVFKSVGFAAEDIAVAKFAYEQARARGIGQEL